MAIEGEGHQKDTKPITISSEAERRVGFALLGLISLLAFQVRSGIDAPDTVLDIDTINFGLSSIRFSLLDNQPHPPGYPGYVLYLKALALLFNEHGPVALAKLGNLIASTLVIPATWWVCRKILLLQGEKEPKALLTRPLLAALFAAFHPLLWFYGADGQSHSAEALGTILFIGLSIVIKASPRQSSFLLLVALFGLSGSIRPTLALLNAPMLIWVVWGKPLRWWMGALVTGIASVLVWYLPLIWASGGPELYARITRALVDELYFRNMSPLSDSAVSGWVRVNLWVLSLGLIVALLPLIAWSPRGGKVSGRDRGWSRVLWSIIGLNALFYGMVFISESGYLLGLAALACLAPASWPERVSRGLQLRTGLTLLILPGFFLLGPEESGVPGSAMTAPQPTLAHTAKIDVSVRHFVETTCASAQGQPSLFLTDNSVVTHTRLLPLSCPGALSGVYLARKPYNLDLDNWLFYLPDQILSYPTEVPLEVGPGVEATLPNRLAYVAIGMDSTEGFRDQILSIAKCPPILGEGHRGEPLWPDMPLIFSATCIPTLNLGENTIHISPLTQR